MVDMDDMVTWTDPTKQHSITAFLKEVRREGKLGGRPYVEVSRAISHLRRLLPYVSEGIVLGVVCELEEQESSIEFAESELKVWRAGRGPIPGYNFRRNYGRFLVSPLDDPNKVVVPFNEECARRLKPVVPLEYAQAEMWFLVVLRMFRRQYESTGFVKPAAKRPPKSLAEALTQEVRMGPVRKSAEEALDDAEKMLLQPLEEMPNHGEKPGFWQMVRFNLRRVFLRRGWAELTDDLSDK